MPAKDCHSEALSKKETFKPDTSMTAASFILKDMQDRKAKTADMEKLKSYPGGTEQK